MGLSLQSHKLASANVEASSECYRRSVFTAFLDHVLQEMTSRFSEVNKFAAMDMCLLSCKVLSLPTEMKKTLFTFYGRDLPSRVTFHQEIVMWKTLWGLLKDPPSSITATLIDDRVSRTTFPNLVTIWVGGGSTELPT